MENIIQPHQLGVDSIDFKEPISKKSKHAFNHRGQSYMGFPFFVKTMEKLWKEKISGNFANCSKYDFKPPQQLDGREDYFKFLQNSHIGVGCFDGSKGSGGASWSIGVTDGLSLGVPYILPNK